MSFIREDVNEHGAPISVMVCDTCGSDFTICPPVEDPEKFPDCTSPECASYDEERDMDILLGDREGLDRNRQKFSRPVDMQAFRFRKGLTIERSKGDE